MHSLPTRIRILALKKLMSYREEINTRKKRINNVKKETSVKKQGRQVWNLRNLPK